MLLADYFRDRFRPVRLLDARPSTLAEYRSALLRWGESNPGLNVEAVDPLALSRVASLVLSRATAATANKVIRHLLAILRDAKEAGLLPALPAWKKLREDRHAPLAFTFYEFRRLLDAAKAEQGMIGGIQAGLWLQSILLTDWFSGARIGALLSVTTADVLIDRGGFYVRSEDQKQHADQFFTVDPYTVELWRLFWEADRPLMWPLNVSRRQLYRRMGRIMEKAQVSNRKGKRFHRIRCSVASYLKAAGGNPTEQLGHSSPAVTKHYYDPRIVGDSSIYRFMPKP